MKKIILSALLTFLTINLYAEQRVQESVKFDATKQRVAETSVVELPKEELGAAHFNCAEGFGRGLVNIMTCWLELPREVVYQSTSLPPGIGTLAGLGMGTVMTVYRCGIGVLDVVTFGMTDSFFYEYPEFPNFVWEARWLAK